jgi:hypothetical protein
MLPKVQLFTKKNEENNAINSYYISDQTTTN